MKYATSDEIKSFAEAPEADENSVWDILSDAASRVFDRAAGVTDGFFAPAAVAVSEKTFPRGATQFLELPPYVAGSIESVKIVSGNIEIVFLPAGYTERDGFLIFDELNFYYAYPPAGYSRIKISARWGFADVPADVKQAVIEQAIFMWRRKDASFTEMSGVSSAVVAQQLSPTCQFVADKYREKYQHYFV